MLHAAVRQGDRRPALLTPACHPNPARHRHGVLGPQHVDLPLVAWLPSRARSSAPCAASLRLA